jgi:hypothetical protein
LTTARTALVLHGHTLLTFFAAERLLRIPPSAPREPTALGADGWTVRIAGAATLASAASDEQSGYNEVFIAREGRDHHALVRAVRLDGGQWQPEPGVAFRPGSASESSLSDLTADAGRPTGAAD